MLDGALDQGTSSHSTGGETTGPLSQTSLALLLIASIVVLIVHFLLQTFAGAAFLTGCLDIADGKPVTIGSFFKPRRFGAVILASLLIDVLTTVGLFLCIIPGLIFAFFAWFTIPFVIDRSLPVIEALKASIATVRSNIGSALLSWLVQLAVVIVGALPCGLALPVAVPVAALILIYTYRKLSGGQVVALDQPGYQPGPPPGYQPGPPPGIPPGPQLS
jgi:uncharacterized membrane protein